MHASETTIREIEYLNADQARTVFRFSCTCPPFTLARISLRMDPMMNPMALATRSPKRTLEDDQEPVARQRIAQEVSHKLLHTPQAFAHQP